MPDDTKPVPPPELIPFLDAVAEMVADACRRIWQRRRVVKMH